MAYAHKPGTFSLFKNDRKEKDTHPDYKGLGKDADGNDIEVAAWLKEGAKGKFMSCTFKARDAAQTASRPNDKKPISRDGEDEIPFANPYRGRLSYVV